MKRLILTLTFLVILLIGGCEVIHIIEAPQRARMDSLIYEASADTTHADTTKYPIGFEVEVEDWKEVTINK